MLVTIEKPGGDRLPLVSFDTTAYRGVATDGNVGLAPVRRRPRSTV